MWLKQNKKILKLLKKLKTLKFLIPVIGLVIINIGVYELIKMYNVMFIVFGVMINIIIVYLCITVRKQKKEIEKLNEHIEFLNTTNENLMELNDNIRSFKHDFNNIMQAIDGYILLGDMQALKKYFSKLLQDCNHIKNLELLTTNAIDNPAIYGVLLNKYKLAERKNINMNIDVLMDFTNIGDKSYSLSRIIGILLDNAIEASLECEEKYINVQFSQYKNNTVKRIVIENTYINKDVDTNMIFQKDYSTKKAKGNSGLGLWKVRDLINKESEMLLQTTKDTKLFRQELEITV